MSTPFAAGPNPYASPVMPPAPAPILPAGASPTSLECMRAYNYIFENPDWMTTVLLLGLICIGAMIPGVGIFLQLLFIGYQYMIVDSLLATQGRFYPTFDFGRLGDYLSRGLWPFLVSLVASFVLLPVLYIGFVVGVLAVGGLASSAGDDIGPVIGLVLGGILALVFAALLFVAIFYLAAMTIRSGLAQDFGSAFQFQWLNDFVRRMWVDMIVAGLFMMVSVLVLEILGLLAFCVGIFFVMPLFLMAQAHFLYQLYAIYLSRGGSPVLGKTQYLQPSLAPAPPPFPPKPM
jgi:hypothetical protein